MIGRFSFGRTGHSCFWTLVEVGGDGAYVSLFDRGIGSSNFASDIEWSRDHRFRAQHGARRPDWLARSRRAPRGRVSDRGKSGLRRHLGGTRLNSPITIDAGWRSVDIGWVGGSCGRSRALSRRTRYCGGIGSSLCGSGRTREHSDRRGVCAEIRGLVVWMAIDNPTWGYTRIQGALTNVGHRVGRSTIARILKAQGLRPCRGAQHHGRRFSGRTGARWRRQISLPRKSGRGADGDLLHRVRYRPRITPRSDRGVTPHPDGLFMRQVNPRTLSETDGFLSAHRALICDRDAKWERGGDQQLLGMRACTSCGPRFERRMRTLTPSGSCGRSSTSASIG